MALIKLDSLQTKAPFSGLFPIDPKVLDAITESMNEHGFDLSKPIDVWGNIVIDGHTRLQAARAARLDKVAAFQHTFEDEYGALQYAIATQRDRRNITEADLARCVQAVDQLRPRGGDRRSVEARLESKASGDAFDSKSAADTAKLLGVSQAKVERTRTVLRHADQGTLDAVENGEKSINAAYRETQEKRRQEAEAAPIAAPVTLFTAPQRLVPDQPFYTVQDWEGLTAEERATLIELAPLTAQAKFNRTNDNVEWALWTWNPVTGCLHNCDYCYARDIANRWYEQLFVPAFLPERLHAPRRMKVPAAAATNIGEKNVFVCSMADLFGKWVPQDWIDAVFAQVAATPAWNFLFLTKFPQRLAEVEWPENAWCGTTVDRQYRVEIAERAFRGVKAGVKWLSCEPLLERLTFSSLAMFDWVVIGGQSRSTQTPEFQPPWEWVEHLLRQARDAGCKVYLKPNLTVRPREYPGQAIG